jgi:hypothetical protein
MRSRSEVEEVTAEHAQGSSRPRNRDDVVASMRSFGAARIAGSSQRRGCAPCSWTSPAELERERAPSPRGSRRTFRPASASRLAIARPRPEPSPRSQNNRDRTSKILLRRRGITLGRCRRPRSARGAFPPLEGKGDRRAFPPAILELSRDSPRSARPRSRSWRGRRSSRLRGHRGARRPEHDPRSARWPQPAATRPRRGARSTGAAGFLPSEARGRAAPRPGVPNRASACRWPANRSTCSSLTGSRASISGTSGSR